MVNNEQFKRYLTNYRQAAQQGWQRPLVVGVLNVTPDSFSDGGRYNSKAQAIKHAHELIAQGADIIDIGGESSRPGATPVSTTEELSRVIPVIQQLHAESDCCISIDTTKAEVMYAAAEAGAGMINDISALTCAQALGAAKELAIPVCLMHMQGKPANMQNKPYYEPDVVSAINLFLQQQINRCCAAGIQRDYLIIDPGFGFGKTVDDNLRIVRELKQFSQHKLPVLLGVSRKSTLGAITKAPIEQRLASGLAIAVWAGLQQVAMIRTHDVAATSQALIMIEAIMQTGHSDFSQTDWYQAKAKISKVL